MNPSTTETAWHHCYRKWFDHDRAGHGIRAAAWGWVADRLANLA